ncbi:unnamed protein product, partial [Rotaria sp. Silwood2]
KSQLKLDEIWSKHELLLAHISSIVASENELLSSVRSSSSSSHIQAENSPGEVNIVNTTLYYSCTSMPTSEVVLLSSVPSSSLSHVKVGNFADKIEVADKSVHEGIIAKLRYRIATDCLELNRCVAHSFALVGSHASYELKTQSNQQPVLAESIVKLEETIRSQALIGYLQEAMYNFNVSVLEREHSKNLFNLIFDDEFLFLIHMHYDLHESILGAFT